MSTYAHQTGTNLGTERPFVGPWAAVTRALSVLGVWCRRAEQRRQLANLSDHLLRDIGISRRVAAREAREPFWRR